MKRLHQETETLYVWRNLELSGRKLPDGTFADWVLAYNGNATQTLPCGQLSRTFLSLYAAKVYLQDHGFTLEDTA